MTSKELDAAKMLLMINSMLLVCKGVSPSGPQLRISREQMIESMMLARSGSTVTAEAMCVGGVLGFFTHGEKPGGTAKEDYPSVYDRVESEIFGDENLRNYLSAVADCLKRNGDSVAYERLVAAGHYVESSTGKDVALRELGVTASNSSRRKTGCCIPLVLMLGLLIFGFCTSLSRCKRESNKQLYNQIKQFDDDVNRGRYTPVETSDGKVRYQKNW